MRLAKLTVSGFKSFADRTEFRFDSPVTGIVGPNGCGKSNIVDAIKWVLGERSSKSLRGTEMLDVIFAGSAGRKPGGMASVSLTFENPVVQRSHVEVAAAMHARPEEGIDAGQPRGGGKAEGVVAGGEAASDAGATEELNGARAQGVEADSARAEGGNWLVSAAQGAEGGEGGDSVIDAAARSRRVLPIDADTVEVERRLYRDGESAYLINGRRARLKDIRELFLDTGVGADAYSIIEQGKVDAMLLASPQERRTIFEEAAGIAKYKQRRIEAQRKLDRAQSNLVAARDQLESTERRLKLVRGQAAKARKFQEFDSELKAWRLALAFEQYDDLEQRILGLVGRHAGLSGEREAASQALTQLEAGKQNAELARQEATSRHKSLEQERLGAVHAEQQAAQRRSMLERSIVDAQRQVSLDKDRFASAEQRRAETEKAIENHRNSLAEMAAHLAGAEARLASAAEQRAGVLEALNERRQAASTKVAAVTRIDRERVGLLASISSDAKRADAVKEQAERLTEKASRVSGDEATLEMAAKASQAAVAQAAAHVQTLEKQLAAMEEAVGRLSTDRRARAERVGKLDSEFVRSDSRRATLHEMVESRSGFAQAVRQVLSAKESGKGLFGGVIAPLADLIETRSDAHADIAAAIEVALGGDLQGLVVRDAASLPGKEDFASIKGRVMFLPLVGMGTDRVEVENGEPVGAAQPSAAAEAMGITLDRADGRVVHLRSLVQARSNEHEHGRPPGVDAAGLERLLDRLLGNTYLVDDLDTALLLRAGPLRGTRCRFVTRGSPGANVSANANISTNASVNVNNNTNANVSVNASGNAGGSAGTGAGSGIGACVIDADGRVSTGSAGAGDESTGILRRRVELEMLQATLTTLWAELNAERDALKSVDAEAGQMSAAAGQARTQLAASQRTALTEQNKLERVVADLQRLGRERGGLEQELKQLQERHQRLEDDRAKLRERAESLGRLQEEEQRAASELDGQVKAMNIRADAVMEQSTAAKIEVNKFGEQLHAARREVGRLEASRDDLGCQARELDTQVQRLDARIAEQAGMIEECVEQISQAQAQVIRLTAEAMAAHSESAKADASVKEIALAAMEARTAYSAVEREWHSLELAKRELEVKRENLQERAAEDLRLDLQTEYGEYQQMMAGGDVRRIDTSEAALRIDTLREAVKKLGSVNIEAIDEESTLEEQNQGLVTQVADIDAACAQLRELITRLNEVSRVLFGEVFTRIQQNFGGDGGMFRKLFNGGKAEVRLMPLFKEVEEADGTIRKVETQETDLLESGIEVVAKPPGKEPRSINQLSGGEKTLTAVALLMSIFRSKPSCFCILDEVDAALDEGNVGRFNTVVREYTDRSSFIVITHNKRTMQTADRLYGVTMQERGVSTRVSVRFDQVGKDGAIKSSVNGDHAETDGSTPPKLRGAGEGSLLNTGLTNAPVVVVAGQQMEPVEFSSGEVNAGGKRVRRKSLSREVATNPTSLREALAAMRELAHPTHKTEQSANN